MGVRNGLNNGPEIRLAGNVLYINLEFHKSGINDGASQPVDTEDAIAFNLAIMFQVRKQ